MGKIKFVKKAKATKEKVVETADTEIQLPAVTYSSDAKITKVCCALHLLSPKILKNSLINFRKNG